MTFAARTVGYLSLASANTGTLISGTGTDGSGGNYTGFDLVTGTSPTRPFGSVSPNTFVDGKTFYSASEVAYLIVPSWTDVIRVSGFSSDPGISYCTSFTINGVTNTTASATYVYNPPGYPTGTAQWVWVSNTGTIWNMTSGNTYTWTKT